MGSGGPEGPSRWPKATSPPQELEVGGRRPPYLLVPKYHKNCFNKIFIGEVFKSYFNTHQKYHINLCCTKCPKFKYLFSFIYYVNFWGEGVCQNITYYVIYEQPLTARQDNITWDYPSLHPSILGEAQFRTNFHLWENFRSPGTD